MAAPLLPHSAGYTILTPGGAAAGTEELLVAAHGDGGLRVTSAIATEYPVPVEAGVDWELDAGLVTRRLLIQSRNGWGDSSELELTVTGNGLLAHRVSADGPTQVELGWGPDAELDYLSAAFAAVMAATTTIAAAETRHIDTVSIGVEDLLPEVVARELTLLPGDGESRRLLNRVVETGREVELVLDPSGALRSYEGLLRLERLSLGPAPTK
jgi:hypothetical protein